MPKKRAKKKKKNFVCFQQKKRVGYVRLEKIDVVLSDLDLSVFVVLHFFSTWHWQ